MPTHDFKDIGNVLDYELLKGIITAIDSATDTCMVNVGGVIVSALLFYHCEPDSIARENGAIEGAAGGFSVDDEVIVLLNNDKSVIKVIGHTDGIRHCGKPVVFTIELTPAYFEGPLTKKAALVWDAGKNSAHNWGTVENPLIVIDYDNADFQAWLAIREDISEPMFGIFLPDAGDPHKLEPELIDIGNMDYHANADSPEIFPETIYAGVFLPDSLIIYAGLRTSKQTTGSSRTRYWYQVQTAFGVWHWEDSDDAELPEYPEGPPYPNYNLAYWQEWAVQTYDYGFNGFFGNFANFIGSFIEWNESNGETLFEDVLNVFIPSWLEQADDPTWPTDKRYAFTHRWYDSFVSGKYAEKVIADACMVQFTRCTHDYMKFYGYNYTFPEAEPYSEVESWTLGSREIYVQAQALHIPGNIAGYDWVAEGRNTALETQLIAAINMAYSLNEIPANEIRECTIGIEIMGN